MCRSPTVLLQVAEFHDVHLVASGFFGPSPVRSEVLETSTVSAAKDLQIRYFGLVESVHIRLVVEGSDGSLGERTRATGEPIGRR